MWTAVRQSCLRWSKSFFPFQLILLNTLPHVFSDTRFLVGTRSKQVDSHADPSLAFFFCEPLACSHFFFLFSCHHLNTSLFPRKRTQVHHVSHLQPRKSHFPKELWSLLQNDSRNWVSAPNELGFSLHSGEGTLPRRYLSLSSTDKIKRFPITSWIIDDAEINLKIC